jgi:hypothetical protein
VSLADANEEPAKSLDAIALGWTGRRHIVTLRIDRR